MFIKKVLRKSAIIALSLCLASCAVVKATNQPGAKDLSVLQKNTPRASVVAELGKPVTTEVKHGKKVDVFSFVQGYSKVTKTARAVGHGVADVMTLGLWEAVGTPIEGLANGEVNQVEVQYDSHGRVEKVIPLKGSSVAKRSA